MKNVGFIRFEVGYGDSSSKLCMLWQYTKLLSLRKYCKNALSLNRKNDTFSPFSSRFFSFSLDARISAAFFIIPNPVPSHSTRADQIIYELSIVQFQI